MSLFRPSLYKIAGFAKWMRCKKVPGRISLQQLDSCRRCPSAWVNNVAGFVFLSCGEPGEDHLQARDPTCGCGLGRVPLRAAREILPMPDPYLRREALKAAMVPAGKTRCLTSCPQRRW